MPSFYTHSKYLEIESINQAYAEYVEFEYES